MHKQSMLVVFGLLLLCGWKGTASHAQAFEPALGSLEYEQRAPQGVHHSGLAIGHFVENLGQWPEQVLYQASWPDLTLWVERDGVRLQAIWHEGSKGWMESAVRWSWPGAEAGQPPSAGAPLRGVYHYYLGEHEADWRVNARSFESLTFAEAWPGVDLVLRAQAGHAEYDLVVHANATLTSIPFVLEGQDALEATPEQTLRASLPGGAFEFSRPMVFAQGSVLTQESGAAKAQRVLRRVTSAREFEYVLLDRHPGEALVIDPGITWSGYLGGSKLDTLTGALYAPDGDLVLAGHTPSSNFPWTLGSLPYTGKEDGFVSRIDPTSNQLVMSTLFGGKQDDFINALALHPDGGFVFAGYMSGGTGFPTTAGAFDTTYNDAAFSFVWDAFVARLTPDGSGLVFSTLLGAFAADVAQALDVAPNGDVVVGGLTSATNFPTTPGAWQPLDPTPEIYENNCFLTRLSADGSSLVYSTYIAASLWEQILVITVLDNGDVVAGGTTISADFPTTPGAFDPLVDAPGAGLDAFVLRLSSDGSNLVFSTILGGSSGSFQDFPTNVVELRDGSILVAGGTGSPDFPVTQDAYQTVLPGVANSVFLSVLSFDGTQMLYSTFFGGVTLTSIAGLRTDASGVVTITGTTYSPDLPVTPGTYPALGSPAGFVSRFDPSLKKLMYSTFLSGSLGSTQCYAVDVDASGNALVGGWTSSPFFPTTPGQFASYHALGDGFATVFDMLPPGVSKYGSASPSCVGGASMGTISAAIAGASDFEVSCSNATPNSPGLLAISFASSAGVEIEGITSWIDLFGPLVLLPAQSGQYGWCSLPLVLPPNSTGVTFYAQFAWLDLGACAPQPNWSASDALQIVVQ